MRPPQIGRRQAQHLLESLLYLSMSGVGSSPVLAASGLRARIIWQLQRCRLLSQRSWAGVLGGFGGLRQGNERGFRRRSLQQDARFRISFKLEVTYSSRRKQAMKIPNARQSFAHVSQLLICPWLTITGGQ